MKRVAVVGCPGAGKTTFTRKLARLSGLPVIHLDYYHHLEQYDYPHNLPAWSAKVIELAKQDAWIMDGNYNSSIEYRFKRADTIFLFDFPRRKSLYGVFKRRLQTLKKRRQEMPDGWKEQLTLGFLVYVWNFKHQNRETTMQELNNTIGKDIHIFKNHTQANAYLATLNNKRKTPQAN